jgi:hypothetical protein
MRSKCSMHEDLVKRSLKDQKELEQKIQEKVDISFSPFGH